MTEPLTSETLPVAIDDLAERIVGRRPWGTPSAKPPAPPELDENHFAARHRARRAAAMAAYLRRWSGDLTVEEVAAAAEGFIRDDAWWQALAQEAGIKADRPPSMTTRAMTVGLLSMPEEMGLWR